MGTASAVVPRSGRSDRLAEHLDRDSLLRLQCKSFSFFVSMPATLEDVDGVRAYPVRVTMRRL